MWESESMFMDLRDWLTNNYAMTGYWVDSLAVDIFYIHFSPCPCGIFFCDLVPSSWSSCHAASTNIHDPLPPPVTVVHCSWYVFKVTSCISTELLYIDTSWSSCLCSSMGRSPQDYVTYALIPASPAVSRMSGSSNLDNFHDGWLVAVQLLLVVCYLQDLFNIACSILV